MIFLAVVAIGQLRSQAKLLILVPRRRILSFCFLLIVRYGVRFCPARQHIGLSCLVNRYVLIRAAFFVCISTDLNAAGIFVCGKQAYAFFVTCQGTHRPVHAPVLQIPVIQQIQI